MGVRVGVAKWRYTDLSVMGVRVGVANFFLDQSIYTDLSVMGVRVGVANFWTRFKRYGR